MRRWWPTIVAGLMFGGGALIAAVLAGMSIGGLEAEQHGQVRGVSLVFGTVVTGWLCWWLIVERPGRLSVWRGAVTGVGVALLSYPVVLALAGLIRPDGVWGTIGARLVKVIQLSALGIATTGFAAALVMAVAGGIAALVLRRAYPAAPAHPLVRGLARAGVIAAVAVVGLLTAVFVALTLIPLGSEGLGANRPMGTPAATYEEAIAAFDAVKAEEASLPLDPRCRSKLLTHGAKVAEVVIFLHGLTNCPHQADQLAAQLYELGYNVYIPRLPLHGEDDRMTLALADLTAEAAVDTLNRSVDLAQGLGEEVIVTGLSAGGVLTMWAAQSRSDVGHTVAMAPFIAPYGVPYWANRAATNLLLLLPNIMMDWDTEDPLGPAEMDYTYPRVATHALAQFMRLGEIVTASAGRTPPLATSLGILLNEADDAVNDDLALRVAAAWRGHGREVDLAVIPAAEGLIHDLIDPRQPQANTAFVYPLVIEMIGRRAPVGAGP